jgi:hypothetical protein
MSKGDSGSRMRFTRTTADHSNRGATWASGYATTLSRSGCTCGTNLRNGLRQCQPEDTRLGLAVRTRLGRGASFALLRALPLSRIDLAAWQVETKEAAAGVGARFAYRGPRRKPTERQTGQGHLT